MPDIAEPVGPARVDERGTEESPDGMVSPDEPVSTVLVEVAPGVVAAYGDLPAELGLESLDLALIPKTDREVISTALAAVGNTATVAGNLTAAAANSQGLYRLADTSVAHMARTGGKLAIKDSANLGTIISPGGGLAQARFIPVGAAGVATLAASVGPALAMLALQASLNQLNDLARTNIALTSQVLTEARHESWSELTGLIVKVEKTTERARQAGAVTENLWLTVAGKGADLETQRDRYRRKVNSHVKEVAILKGRARREYLETNAEAIAFDSYALLSSLKAWFGYQALFAARERAAGPEGSAEARVAEAIAQDTRAELGPALEEITNVIGALSRELQLIAELPGRSTLPGTKKRKDTKTSRQTTVQLLEALQPITDNLLPPLPEFPDPDVLCLPEGVEHEKYLTVLRLLLDREETLRAVALSHQLVDGEVVDELVQKLARRARWDAGLETTMIAVTSRRILTSQSKEFLQTGDLRDDTSIDDVRYVRRTSAANGEDQGRVDLITKDRNVRWSFHPGVESLQIDGLASVLAESMTIPDSERTALAHRRPVLTESDATDRVEPAASDSPSRGHGPVGDA